jgi:hypothetical protein
MMVGGFAFSAGLFLFGCKCQYLAEPPRTYMRNCGDDLHRRLTRYSHLFRDLGRARL